MDSRTDPKDQQTIRKALNAIRSEANILTPAGPHMDGMSPDHPVLVATFLDRDIARQFQKILIAAEIDPDIATAGNSIQVTVGAKDAKRATGLYFDHKENLNDGQALRHPRRHDMIFLGAILGLTLGAIAALIFTSLPKNFSINNEVIFRGDDKTAIGAADFAVWVRTAKVSLLILALFVIGGHLADRYRMKQFKDPKLRRAIDIWELMWLFAMPILAWALFSSISELLPLLRFN